MIHKKMDLMKHMPKHPVTRVIGIVFSLAGLLGLWGSLTHADLQIQSTINNVLSTFKELQITTDGSPQGAKKVILNTGGIWVDTGNLGGTPQGVLKVSPQGYIFRGLVNSGEIAPNSITGLQIASGSITINHLGFVLTGGTGTGGSASLNCPAGQAVIGVTGGVAQCAPIIGTGDCGSTGLVQGWSSTGLIICSNSAAMSSGIGGAGGSLWHPSPTLKDIFYGTVLDDNDGNVGIGLDTPLAKLHIKGSLRVDTSGAVQYIATGAGGLGYYTVDTNIKGFIPSFCAGGTCWESSAFNPYMPTSQIRGINVINAQSVELYLEDPTAPKYTWQLSTSTPTIPRCSCDVSATTFDCGNGTISAHTDPYCVDVADNSNDNTYPGPGGGPNTNTPLPVVFYAYIGPYSSLQTSTTAVPGFIAKQARVGVNTLTPQAAFDVVGNVRFASYAGVGIRNLGVDSLGNVRIMPLNPSINPWQNGSSNSIFYNAGHVGIGTTSPSTTLHVQGDMLATAYYLISDETLKENIVPIQDALQKLESINGYSFTWKGSNKSDIGILAQEVEDVLPQLVRTNDRGFKSVEYPNLIALVIEAMKELNDRATDLSQEYQNQENVTQLIQQYDANEAVLLDLQNRVSALENAQG